MLGGVVNVLLFLALAIATYLGIALSDIGDVCQESEGSNFE
jgi:hypothetical protein